MALLDEVKSGLIVLQARRQQEIHVPEVRKRIVEEARQRRGPTKLNTDVGAAPHDRKAGEFVATRLEGHGGASGASGSAAYAAFAEK